MEKEIQEIPASVFVEYFGASPYIKVLDFLLDGQEFDYAMTEVARGAGVGWSAFTKIWKKLLEKNIIVPTRIIGNAKLFKLNKKSSETSFFSKITSSSLLLEVLIIFLKSLACFLVILLTLISSSIKLI